MQILHPGLGRNYGQRRPGVIDEILVLPHFDFSMAVSEREAARVGMVSSRFIKPVTGGRTGIHAEPTVINTHWIFIDKNPRIGRPQNDDLVLFFEHPGNRSCIDPVAGIQLVPTGLLSESAIEAAAATDRIGDRFDGTVAVDRGQRIPDGIGQRILPLHLIAQSGLGRE